MSEVKASVPERLDAAEAEILEAIREDQGYRSIAADYGVSIGSLVAWIESVPERSRACAKAREQSADQCEEEAERLIKTAKTKFQLAKARELAIHLRWRAKSRNPDRYGDRLKAEINATMELRGVGGRMMERARARQKSEDDEGSQS